MIKRDLQKLRSGRVRWYRPFMEHGEGRGAVSIEEVLGDGKTTKTMIISVLERNILKPSYLTNQGTKMLREGDKVSFFCADAVGMGLTALSVVAETKPEVGRERKLLPKPWEMPFQLVRMPRDGKETQES